MKKAILAIILSFYFALPLLADEITQTNNRISWDEWVNSETVKNYFQEMQTITLEEQQRGLPIQQKLNKKSNLEEIVSELKELGSEIQQKLQKLLPPDQLKIYHQKKVKTFEYGNLATIAMVNNDVDKARNYTKQMYEESIGADEDLKSVYKELGAASEILAELDRRIQQGKNEMRQYVY